MVVSAKRTLSVDVGGTAVKAAVLDEAATLASERVSIPTPYPLGPDDLLTLVMSVAGHLGDHERASLGFPGMVRDGHVLTAPFFVTAGGPGTPESFDLVRAWSQFDLQGRLAAALDRPVRVANDADVHGAGVVEGHGLELVITLGTGFGTALFLDGRVCPHLELAHHPFRDDETYNEHLGNEAMRQIGTSTWNRRVRDALDTLGRLVHPDHVWIGGGNARYLTGALPADASLAAEDSGLVGGVRLWGDAGERSAVAEH